MFIFESFLTKYDFERYGLILYISRTENKNFKYKPNYKKKLF